MGILKRHVLPDPKRAVKTEAPENEKKIVSMSHPIDQNGTLTDTMTASSSQDLKGSLRAPGDKSISHRALILGALAQGETVITGLLTGDDVLRTAAAIRALGAIVERDGELWRVIGAPWVTPSSALYFGNAGTGSRLVMGAVAGAKVSAIFDGDASLRARPMGRILDPLAEMGTRTKSNDGKMPCHIEMSALAAVDFTLPKASAQIKSAVLLAALGAEGETIVREPELCRDHTERMLAVFGADISVEPWKSGRLTRLKGGQSLMAAPVNVPGDPSSAAFLVAAALITPGSEVTIRNVLMNPHRIGFYETVREMGADISYHNERIDGEEPIADILVRSSRLKGLAVPADRAASMIDEYPILSVVAAFADGDTYMSGISELRIKESDRIAATETGLRACGVEVESGDDWLRVSGRAGDVPGGGKVASHHDHRIAMSFLILGLAAREPVITDSASMIATSFPEFATLMRQIGATISKS